MPSSSISRLKYPPQPASSSSNSTSFTSMATSSCACASCASCASAHRLTRPRRVASSGTAHGAHEAHEAHEAHPGRCAAPRGGVAAGRGAAAALSTATVVTGVSRVTGRRDGRIMAIQVQSANNQKTHPTIRIVGTQLRFPNLKMSLMSALMLWSDVFFRSRLQI